jgi:PilZ domain
MEADPPMTDDDRFVPRRRVLKGAKIIFADGTMVVDCVIRNWSVAGARLDVPATLALPHAFTLLDVQTQRRYIATVAWRRGDQMGVEFSDAPDGDEQDDR